MTHFFSLPYHYRLQYLKNTNILAEDYKVIYFNTQKNANSTMKAQFVEILGIEKTENFPYDIHQKYDFPSALQEEIRTKYQGSLRFAILRNPYERLASCYKNKIKQGSKTGPDFILECSSDFYIGMPFEEFVEVVCVTPDSEADFHFCSQIYLFLYSDGFFPINYLCNMENLAFHIEDIKSKTGIPFAPLTQLNSSKKSDYQSLYTPTLIEKVRQRYQADITFFNYEFGKKNEDFSFGKVSKKWLNMLQEHPLMLSILKEKNNELLKQIELKKLPQTKELKNLKNELIRLKKVQKRLAEREAELEAMENSISWRITAPLRNLIAPLMDRKNKK